MNWDFASAQHDDGDQPSCLVASSVLSKNNASSTHRAFGVGFFWGGAYLLLSLNIGDLIKTANPET